MRLILLSMAFLLLYSSTTFAQPNIGFEYNNLSFWKCYRDNTFTIPSTNGTTNTTTTDLYNGTTYYVAGSGVKTRYIRVTSKNQKNDIYGNYPVVCPFPGSGNHSVKLGTDSVNDATIGYYGRSTAQGITYNIKIPVGNQKFKIVYYYAIDLESPTTHTCDEMPFFSVEAFDSVTKAPVAPCSNFGLNICDAFVSDTSWGAWHRSTVFHSPYNDPTIELDTVYYVNWTPSTIIAKNMGGRTVTMRFTSAGCTPGAHFGYAYVDFDTTASAVLGDTLRYCPHDSCFNFPLQPGYRSYQIMDSVKSAVTGNDTAILLANVTSTNTLTAALCGTSLPKPKSVVTVILTNPIAGYGCTDTLFYYIDTLPYHFIPPIQSSVDSICAGFSTLLTDTYSAGVWKSDSTNIATINASSGNFTGISNGFDSVLYIASKLYATNNYSESCSDTDYKKMFVVGHSTQLINGRNGVCLGDTIHLSDSTYGGVWSIDNTSLATIDQQGVVKGLTYGLANVKYVFTNYFGCKDSTTKSLQIGIPPLPGIFGSNVICTKHSALLSNATAGGLWSSSNISIATIDPTSGNVTGISSGIDTIKYTLAFGGCSDSVFYPITIKAPILNQINGNSSVCQNHKIQLSNASIGNWESVNTNVATIDNQGNITPGIAGTDTIRYVINSNGCTDSVFKVVTVNPAPIISAISGPSSLCFGVPATFTDVTGGGNWFSTDTTIFKINTSGLIQEIKAGTATIRYIVSNSSGCTDSVSTNFTILQSPVAYPISGTNSVCQKHTTQLSTTSTGGIWHSQSTTIATINNQGLVTPVNAGTDTVRYVIALGNGCKDSSFTVITVNPAPKVGAINGPSSNCLGVPATFTDTTAGGIWESLDTTIFKISSSGVIQYIKAGTTTIRFIVTNSAGCIDSVSTTFTVNPIPDVKTITGNNSVCTGNTSTLTETTTGGVWSSSNTAVATISGSTVTGIKSGVVTIKYTVSNAGCTDSATFNFAVVDYPVVSSISGSTTICIGNTATYSDATPNGVWAVTNPAIATINNGIVTPLKLGVDTIYYNLSVPPGCADTVYYKITVDSFAMSLNYTPKPVLQNTTVNIIINSASPAYTITAWTPAAVFSSQTATSQIFTADTSVYVCATGISTVGNCVYTACDSIIVTPINTTIFIPNVIKINANSAANATVMVHTVAPSPDLKALEFKIYNQWGELIFSTNEVKGAWDGKVNGTIQPVGVYVYVAKCTTQDNKIINKKGSITLVK